MSLIISRTSGVNFDTFSFHHPTYSLEKLLVHLIVASRKLAHVYVVCIYRYLVFPFDFQECGVFLDDLD